MKKLFFIFIFFLSPLLLFSHTNKVYKVVIRSDWEPYYFINTQGKPDGYAIELFDLIAKEAHLDYKFVLANNFQEIIQLLQEGKVDIIPNISISSERQSLLFFTQPTDDFLVNIYKLSSSTKIENLDDIHDKRVGLVRNNICTKILNQKYTQIKQRFYMDYKALINGLLNKEVDVFCYPKPLIDFENTEHSSIVSLGKALVEIKRGVGVTKENFDVLPLLDEAITNLKLTGELSKLHKKWFNKKSYIELTRSETIFLVLSFFGISFTTLVVIVYFINKKKWLMTNDMLQKEVKKQTQRLEEQNQELTRLQEELKEQLNKDALTNIYNRKFYNQKLLEMLSLFERYGSVFSFVIFDIDDFKKINDTFGHALGDRVLIELTQMVNQHIRITDYLFRIGGEEFVILFANTELEDAHKVAEKLRENIEKELTTLNNHTVTVSMGLTQVHKEDNAQSIFKRADELLYQAKKSGKNQVAI